MHSRTRFAMLGNILLLLLLPIAPALAEELPYANWVMFEALYYSQGDVDRFTKRITYLSDSGPLALVMRATTGNKVLSAKIRMSGQGRDYRKNLYYHTREETRFTGRRSKLTCSMTVYYNPETRRIDSVLCTKDCANDPAPELPGIKLLHKDPTTE